MKEAKDILAPLTAALQDEAVRTKPKSLLEKLHSIMGAVEYIQKDKANTFHKYRYASEQAIKEALHPKLVEERVLFMVSIMDAQHSHGNEQTLTTIQVEYTFLDVDSGEKISGKFYGSGIDSQDKGLYKAITGAIKYILTSTFLIPTGDDPENDSESPQNDRNAPRQARGFAAPPNAPISQPDAKKRLISENQVKRLWAIARGAGWQDLEIREFLSARGYTSSKDIPVSEYELLVTDLEGGSK